MSPGSLNYYRSGSRDRIEPLNIGQATSVTLNQENQRREAIAKNFSYRSISNLITKEL